MTIRISKPAPRFEGDVFIGGTDGAAKITLDDFTGYYLVLFSDSRDAANNQRKQFDAFAETAVRFEALGAKLVGVTADDSHLQEYPFPVVVDKSGAVAQAYGLALEDGGVAHGTFIIGPDGALLHFSIGLPSVHSNVRETLRILDALKLAQAQPGYDRWLAQALPHLPSKVLLEARSRLRPHTFRAGAVIFSQGDPPDRFYIVASGEAVVSRTEAGGKERVVATLGPGEFFGEMGLVTETKRMASVRAKTDLEVLALDWDYVAQVMESNQAAGDAFAEVVMARTER